MMKRIQSAALKMLRLDVGIENGFLKHFGASNNVNLVLKHGQKSGKHSVVVGMKVDHLRHDRFLERIGSYRFEIYMLYKLVCGEIDEQNGRICSI